MSDERRRRIAEIAWRTQAKKKREAMTGSLRRAFDSFAFLDDPESSEFGRRYWQEADKHAYDEHHTLREVTDRLVRRSEDMSVIWLHRFAAEAGALEVRLVPLLRKLDELRNEYGPDVLFASADLLMGVCFEQDEDALRLRWW